MSAIFKVSTLLTAFILVVLSACASPPPALDLTDPEDARTARDPLPLGEARSIRFQSQKDDLLRVSMNVTRQAFGEVSYDWLRLRFENLSEEELIIAPEIEAVDADNTVISLVPRDTATRTLGGFGRDADRNTGQVVQGSTRAASTAAAFSGLGVGALALGLLGPAAAATMGSGNSSEVFADWASTHWLQDEYALPARGSALALVAFPGGRPLPLQVKVYADNRVFHFRTVEGVAVEAPSR